MHRLFKIFSRCEGAVVVEFAIILPVLMLLLLGAMDMAHMYYIEHIITNGSREGARYASKYTWPNPEPTSTAVSNYIKLPAPGLNYNAFNFDTLTVSATYAGSFPDRIATVTVTAKKQWWVLGGLMGLSTKTLSGKTAMNVEH